MWFDACLQKNYSEYTPKRWLLVSEILKERTFKKEWPMKACQVLQKYQEKQITGILE